MIDREFRKPIRLGNHVFIGLVRYRMVPHLVDSHGRTWDWGSYVALLRGTYGLITCREDA